MSLSSIALDPLQASSGFIRLFPTPLATGLEARLSERFVFTTETETETDCTAFSYCGDALDNANQGVIYLQGKNSALADMDVDCDGVQGGPADDGRCTKARSPDYQSKTAFQRIITRYGVGIQDLNAYVHPYVVFGNTGNKPGWRTFDPTKFGVRPLSVVAVVCGDRLVYGIWGDTNGDDGDKPMIGESSLALATACGGKKMAGDYGHNQADVLYLAFTGEDAVPGPKGANWTAPAFEAFEQSIEALGDQLVQRVSANSTTGSKNAAASRKEGLMVLWKIWAGVLSGMILVWMS